MSEREPKRFINWTLRSSAGETIKRGDYSPSNPKSVDWMTRFVMWATSQGYAVIFTKSPKTFETLENI